MFFLPHLVPLFGFFIFLSVTPSHSPPPMLSCYPKYSAVCCVTGETSGHLGKPVYPFDLDDEIENYHYYLSLSIIVFVPISHTFSVRMLNSARVNLLTLDWLLFPLELGAVITTDGACC